MIEQLRQLYAAVVGNGAEPEAETDAQVAAAALLLSIVHADFEVHDKELAALHHALEALLGASYEGVDRILEQAHIQVEESVSLYDFTAVLHREMTNQQKTEVIELLWMIAFADQHLDAQEEFTVRKVARLLHVPHEDFIAAKQRARTRVGEIPH